MKLMRLINSIFIIFQLVIFYKKGVTGCFRGLKSNGTKSTASLYAQLIFTEIALFCMFLTKIRGVLSTELKKGRRCFFS
jgi:hypothetical protein